MTLEEQLTQKLAKAIHDLIKPPVLVGSKWLRHYPSGKPTDFQFIGTGKIAKATGKDAGRIARNLLKKMDLEGLGLTGEVIANGTINFSKGSPDDKAAAKPKKKSQAEAKPEVDEP